jgi:hypothetical protein
MILRPRMEGAPYFTVTVLPLREAVAVSGGLGI